MTTEVTTKVPVKATTNLSTNMANISANFPPDSFYIGVDVGTGSSRACLIDCNGRILAMETHPISKWEPKPNHFNQSSQEIWQSVCKCVRKVIDTAIAGENNSLKDRSQIKGIGFDATCSLVVLNEKSNAPVSVGPDYSKFKEPVNANVEESDPNYQNVILWMDHRSTKQADEINATKHSVLKYVGGKMSPEMEIPKAKWLKENMPKGLFEQCKFYDLADFLTFRATGSEARSFCSTVCKQGYVPVGIDGSIKGWSEEFLTLIGLPELAEDNFRRLGGVNGENGKFLSAGTFVGTVTPEAAKELGVSDDCAVGSGVIDAYAGWIGTVAAKVHNASIDNRKVETRLAAVAGTSTCHLVMSEEAIFVPGVWGPYRDVLIPGKWVAEGGQSCTGELLNHVVTTHPAYGELQFKMTPGQNTFEWLNSHLKDLALHDSHNSITYLARHYFFYGDLHGNRSPIADARMKGSVIGIDMNCGVDELAIAYYGAIEFIAQQTRHIIETLNKAGHQVCTIYLSGSQCRNELLTKLIATATGCTVVIPKYIDSAVVHGSAMLGALAATEHSTGRKESLWNVMTVMTPAGDIIEPEPKNSLNYRLLDAKYDIFLEMASFQQKARAHVDKVLEVD